MRSLRLSDSGLRMLMAASCFCTAFPVAVAQISSDSTSFVATSDGVSTTGSAAIPIEPSILRLSLTASAEARDGESALQTLRDHGQRVEKELVILGVVKESVKISQPSVSVAIPGISNFEQARKAARQQSMQLRAMNAMNAGFAVAGNQPAVDVNEIEEADLPHVYTAKCVITADWKISGAVDDKVRLMPANLRRSILEKDLMGRRFTEKLSAEEQQMIQSVAGNNNVYYSQPFTDSSTFDDPKCRFRFIGNVTHEMLQKAFEIAFKNARAEGDQMAKVANAEVHGTKSIRKVEKASMPQTDSLPTPYAYVFPNNAGTTGVKPKLADDEREIPDIANPTIVLQVFATFKLD
jgi:uncharacterized protein YggE